MRKKDLREETPPHRVQRNTEPIRLKFGTLDTFLPELLCYSFMKTESSRDHLVQGY